MTPAFVGIPIKPFGVAKARLGPALDRVQRSVLGRAVAQHTARRVAESGAIPLVVTGDQAVRRWARRDGIGVVEEPPPGGLDAAAAALVASAGNRPWAIVHADLPLLTSDDLDAVWLALDAGPVVCPSHDGGTSVVASTGYFAFSYGPGSFHRHLRFNPGSAVIVRRGLALDLDTIHDLEVAQLLNAGRWLDGVLSSRTVPT